MWYIGWMEQLSATTGMVIGLALAGLAGVSAGDLMTFENTNPALERLSYYQAGDGIFVLGQSLNVTRGAFDQPAMGELPGGSLLISWFAGFDDVDGDWIFMGPGFNSHIARADELVDVVDPYSNHPVGYIAPADFDDGHSIGDDTNWADSWVAMHTSVSTAPSKGIHFTDESFTIGIRFLLDDGLHYGFAEMTRTEFVEGDPLSIGYRPARWGYETTAGVAVPGAGTVGVLMLGLGAGLKRRR